MHTRTFTVLNALKIGDNTVYPIPRKVLNQNVKSANTEIIIRVTYLNFPSLIQYIWTRPNCWQFYHAIVFCFYGCVIIVSPKIVVGLTYDDLITGVTDIFKMEKGTYAMFCLCFAIFCMVIAFASPYWIESFEKSDNKFVKLGLWEFCFNDYTFYKDYNGKRFLGCWYIFSTDARPLWEWISPREFFFNQRYLIVIIKILYQYGWSCTHDDVTNGTGDFHFHKYSPLPEVDSCLIYNLQRQALV